MLAGLLGGQGTRVGIAVVLCVALPGLGAPLWLASLIVAAALAVVAAWEHRSPGGAGTFKTAAVALASARRGTWTSGGSGDTPVSRA